MVFAFAAAIGAEPVSDCFTAIPLDEEIVTEGLGDGAAAYTGVGQTPTFVVGYLSYLRDAALEGSAPFGSVIFVRRDGRWSAFQPHGYEASVATLAAKDGSTVFFVTQHQVEGPGAEFTLVRSSDGLKTATCTVLPFPSALNRPTYAMETLSEPRIELGPDGRGRLVASAEIDVETDAPDTTWWAYRTRDGGKNWSAPKRLRGEPAPDERFLLPEVADPAPEDLLATIHAQVPK